LKKFKYYVYGVHFLVEIDAKTLVHQLNQPAMDLPGAVVGRWLAYIRMFSFDIQHVRYSAKWARWAFSKASQRRGKE
jgi:hypothetical protein